MTSSHFNYTKAFLFFLFLICLGLIFCPRINLLTADLGRHIKNGAIFFEQSRILTTNYFSYTQPDHPFVNHHWGAGVIFYVLWQWIGLTGISFVFAGILVLATVFFFLAAKRMSGFSYALFFTLLSVPLISSRMEIRPEVFSFLFLGIYFYLLTRFRFKEIDDKVLFVIPFLQILWVNTHIFFIMGPFLLGAFFIDELINEKSPQCLKSYLLVGALTIGACLLNPFGIHGALAPLTIFNEYGYMLAENQSVFFMQNRFPAKGLYPYFEAIFILSGISFALILKRHNYKSHFLSFFLLICYAFLAFKMVRAIVLFGFFFIPFVAANVGSFIEDRVPAQKGRAEKLLCIISFVIILAGLGLKGQQVLRQGKYFAGPFPGVNRSAEFVKRHKIPGPIFNNYDIGGYLIYHLFPEEKVFVDNRPEAYSVSFFKKTYVPMQEDEQIWEKMDRQYQFNMIYFYRHDMTPWAQPFLIRRIQDKGWAPIFVDAYTLILLKRTPQNRALIKRYELPASIFRLR